MKKRLLTTIIFVIAFCFMFSVYAFAGVKVKSVKNTYNGVKVTWKCSNKKAKFAIYRSENGSNFILYSRQRKKSLTDKSVDAGSEYKYKIRAYKVKKHKVKNLGKKTTRAIMATPKAPADLNIVKETEGYSVTWKKVIGASKYNIYRGDKKTGEYELYDVVSYNQNDYYDYDVEPGEKFDYKVQTVQIIDDIQYQSISTDESYFTGKHGIDVSYHNGKINWKKVKKSGVSFAMIRLGYGTKKGGFTDVKLDYNYKQARKNGIKVGFYFYSYAHNKKQAKREAKYTLKLLKKYPNIHYPVSYDFEEPSRNKAKYKKANTAIIKTYCNYLEKRGYDTSVYSYLAFFKNAVNVKKISKYGIWLARWAKSTKHYTSGGISNVQMWQYSSNGRKKGIKGRVDLNIIVK